MITITLLCANQFEASTLNKGVYLFVCLFFLGSILYITHGHQSSV